MVRAAERRRASARARRVGAARKLRALCRQQQAAGAWDARYPHAQEIAARLHLEERVLFRHNISENDLPALIGGAELFVFPSAYEGFGLPPLEALACGTAVACARASSLPEVVGDAAFFFDATDSQHIARVLSDALADASARARL
ncbi:MAG: hypothetical protein DCC52_16620, partial [Chloroflexi bacterium]